VPLLLSLPPPLLASEEKGKDNREEKEHSRKSLTSLTSPLASVIQLTLAAKMYRRLLQHSGNSELFHGRSLAGLQIIEGAESLHGDSVYRCESNRDQDIHATNLHRERALAVADTKLTGEREEWN
jgi:hypothetical protein